jgi:hypothetical protein
MDRDWVQMIAKGEPRRFHFPNKIGGRMMGVIP